MIEENVAIICACLPMCRMPLAFVFPSIFASKLGNSHPYASTDHSRDQPSNTWKPYVGPRKAEGFSRSAAMRTDGASEEYILDPVSGNDSSKESPAIRKTMHYNITYESDPAAKV
jgi:hypothetical protein